MNLLLKYEKNNNNKHKNPNEQNQQNRFEKMVAEMAEALEKRKNDMIFDSINRVITGR